jgi:hypothetical protein
MMTRKLVGGLALVMGLALASQGSLRAAGEKAVTLEDIRAAWKARQERVRSGRFFWKEIHTDAKGYYTHLLRGKDLVYGAKFRK